MRISSDGVRPRPATAAPPAAGKSPAQLPATGASPGPSDGLDPSSDEQPATAFARSLQIGGSASATPAAQAQADRDARTIYEATEGGLTGWGTDEEAVLRTLEGKSASEIDLVRQAYKDHYGKDLDSVVRAELGGKDRRRLEVFLRGTPAPKPEAPLSTIKVAPSADMDPAARLKEAMDGIGTDETAIGDILQPRSKAEIDAIARDYEQRYGHHLRDRLDAELAGRDQVELLEQMFDRGKIDDRDPQANLERLRRLREQQAVEEGFGSWTTARIQDGIKGESDAERLERNIGRAQRSMDAGDRARAARLLGHAEADLDALRQAKDSAADAAATGAAVVASTAVVIGTAGAATPLVVAGAAAVAGGGASAGAYAAVQGDAADPADIAREGLIGAAAGATAGVGLPASAAGRASVAAGARQSAVEIGQLAARGGLGRVALQGAKEGAKAGAAGGAADGAVRSATERETWIDGLAPGMLRVTTRAAQGAAAGAAIGGATGLVTAPAAHAVERNLAHRAEARDLTGAVTTRIADQPEGALTLSYRPSDVRRILAKGRELGLDRQQIEDLVLVGSRTKKPLAADDLIQQMEIYTQVVLPRGYPFRFESTEHFARFKTELRDGLRALGLPADDVRIQGSSLRSPNAADIDIAVVVDEADFQRRLARAFSASAAEPIRYIRGGKALDVASLSPTETEQLVGALRIDDGLPPRERTFNARGRTFLRAWEAGKMRAQESGTRTLVTELQTNHGPLSITIVSGGGRFDVHPQMKLD